MINGQSFAERRRDDPEQTGIPSIVRTTRESLGKQSIFQSAGGTVGRSDRASEIEDKPRYKHDGIERNDVAGYLDSRTDL